MAAEPQGKDAWLFAAYDRLTERLRDSAGPEQAAVEMRRAEDLDLP